MEQQFGTLSSSITRTLKVDKLENQKQLNLAMNASEEVVDEFESTKFTWNLDEGSEEDSDNSRKHSFVLTFTESHRERVLDRYIPHMLETNEATKAEKKIVKSIPGLIMIGPRASYLNHTQRRGKATLLLNRVGCPNFDVPNKNPNFLSPQRRL
ncbi:unnamed protein product [Sphenostylis stenocarpa]|uniref:AAA-type ATPase N-terminal domain-containing protein n=1 Tax=Sphenostylis stenocarpa TaxID=92480 RepID=A0AA86VDA0_9FABA|nr:unnamed protein product [Sphenostylis stenocarpa]